MSLFTTSGAVVMPSQSITDTPDYMSWFQLNSTVANFQQQYILSVNINWLPTDIRDYTVRVYGDATTTIT